MKPCALYSIMGHPTNISSTLQEDMQILFVVLWDKGPYITLVVIHITLNGGIIQILVCRQSSTTPYNPPRFPDTIP